MGTGADDVETPAEFAGEPDGFQRLWTPHRMVYVGGDKPSDEAGEGCPFCAAPDRSDAEGLIVHRGELCYVVLNLFPYNPGHVLVCPYRHVSLYVDLTDEETAEFTALTKQASTGAREGQRPDGLQPRDEPGRRRRGRGGRPPAPARGPALGWRLELPARSWPAPRRSRCCSRTSGRGSWRPGRRAEARAADRLDSTMLNRLLRETWTKVMTPIAKLFLRLGISPDVVTIVGTVGVCVGALAFYPRGQLLVGTLVVTLFIFSDNVDGVMARMSGREGPWGAYLDSTLDRSRRRRHLRRPGPLLRRDAPEPARRPALALACLILGFVVSYSKARAEGLGMTANVGIAERADRLLVGPVGHVPRRPGRLGRPARRRPRAAVRRQPRHRRAADARGPAPGAGPRPTPDQHSPGVSTP